MTKQLTRFAFGKNWRSYIQKLDEEKIQLAVDSLRVMLNKENFGGLRFLDAGCGSGLFSLAALRLGASEVVSFDVDSDSVECAQRLNERFGPLSQWHILHGSVLDEQFVSRLGRFDIVYSWGVLHHTGAMWQALRNIVDTVRPGGFLFLSIYNSQGVISKLWRIVKLLYNHAPQWARWCMASAYYLAILLVRTLSGILSRSPVRTWYKAAPRGMNLWHDAIDWMGGYPFEVATPEALFDFFRDQGFQLEKMKLARGSGCNEFVFAKI